MAKPKEPKPVLTKVTDPEKAKELASKPKYRPKLQFYTRDKEGNLWVEKQV
jgi:hypothetical protein